MDTHFPALALAAPPPLDPRRQLELELWIGHIDRVLAAGGPLHPGAAARRLVSRIDDTGAGTVRRTETQWSLLLLGISARSDASAYALLRNWQAAAMERLEVHA